MVCITKWLRNGLFAKINEDKNMKKAIVMVLVICAVLLNTACLGASEFGSSVDGSSIAVIETEENLSVSEPSVLDGVDVHALLSMKLGEVIDILGSDHSEPYIDGYYNTYIDYGDDCTIAYRATIEDGKPAALDLQADISEIEIFCEKDVYKGISVGKTLDEINDDLELQDERKIFVRRDGNWLEEEELWISGESYKFNDGFVNIWVKYDKDIICRSVLLRPYKERAYGVDITDLGDEYAVLDGVDVHALLSMKLGEVIDILGGDHSEPGHDIYAQSINYKGSCDILYSGVFDIYSPPQIEPDAEVVAIHIIQKLNVYKGISVGKTLDEINSNPDLLNKIELDVDEEGEYLRYDGVIMGSGIYEYGDIFINIFIVFDDNLVCTKVTIVEDQNPSDLSAYQNEILL
jgi:hypothetical protein